MLNTNKHAEHKQSFCKQFFFYLIEQLGLKLTQRFDVPAFAGTDDVPPFFIRPEPVAHAVE